MTYWVKRVALFAVLVYCWIFFLWLAALPFEETAEYMFAIVGVVGVLLSSAALTDRMLE